jgi:ATP-dependent Clp protease ATP-binding subunit ClpA
MDGKPLSTPALIETVQQRAESTDPLALLETAVALAAETGEAADAMVDHYVGAARAAGLSWTVIGDRLGISKQAARQRFSARLEVSGAATESAVLAPRLVACLQAAQAAADADDSVPGTQHLLLGLLHVGVAANVLDRLGVTRDKVREAGARLFEPTGDNPRVVGDGEAEAILIRARRFAAQGGQNLAGTEHVLFLLAMDPGSSARRVLNDLGVDAARLKKEMNECIPPRPRPGRRRRAGKVDPAVRTCSFCGCTDPHRQMVSGPGVRICGECVALATDIIASQHEQAEQGLHSTGRLTG